ncbi:MAG: MFS transporter, partial [Leptospira sp.]|nr:MFS transporter [Leptospira sp.]
FTGFGSLGFMTGPIASVGLENLYNNYFPTEQTLSLLSTSFGVLEIFLVLITIPLLKKMEFK